MHEPARRQGLAAVKTFAVKPEAITSAVFDEVVIAGEAALLALLVLPGRKTLRRAPPFIGNPFRPLRAGDVVSHSAPAQTSRWAIGNERRNFGRLGLRQQQQRARVVLRRRPVSLP